MLAPYLLQAFARPRQQLIERLPVVQAIVPGVRAAQVDRIHVRAALEVPVVPLAEAVEALDGHRAAGHGPRRLAAARERAGVDGVEAHAFQRLCQRRGLLLPGVVERDVGPSLQPVLDVPARLAVPRDIETKAAARLGVRRHRGARRDEKREDDEKNRPLRSHADKHTPGCGSRVRSAMISGRAAAPGLRTWGWVR